MILFLDFDGVLHPDEVFLEYGKPIMRCPPALGVPPEYARLFSYAPILEAAIASRTDIDIVLSTTWVSKLGFDVAKKALPAGLRRRVIGATFEPEISRIDQFSWSYMTRYAQIADYVERYEIDDWFALDDDAKGWPDDQQHRLVWCENATMGLFAEDVQARLQKVLRKKG